MEEATIGCLQLLSDPVALRNNERPSNKPDAGIGQICLDDAIVLESVLPLIDTESGQVLLSGILDGTAGLFDGVQLATLVIEQPTAEGEIPCLRTDLVAETDYHQVIVSIVTNMICI